MRLWACRACGAAQRMEGICPSHGWVQALIADTQESPSSPQAQALCPQCRQPVSAQDGGSLAGSCDRVVECPCGGSRVWTSFDAAALQPDLSQATVADDDTWIKGEFEGEVKGVQGSGELLARARGTHLTGFRWHVVAGRLRHFERVDGPPLALAPDEVHPPLRQDIVSPVVIGRTARRETVAVELHDFRLHHWDLIAPDLTGGVRGIAYGRVRRVREALRPDPVRSAPSPSPSPEEDTSPGPEPSEDCGICAKTLQFALAGLAWWRCGLKTGLVDLAAMLLMCWFSRVLREKTDILSARSQRWRDRLLLALSVAGLALFFYLGWCDQAPRWPLLLPLVAMLMGAFSRSCTTKTLLVLLFQVASWSSCSAGFCAPDNTRGVLGRVSDLIQGTVQELLHQTPIGQAGEQALQSGERPPISIADALQRPQVLEDCRTPIRFESGLLFDFDKSDLRLQNEADLGRLLQLTQLERFKDRTFVITGHADRVGDDSAEGKLHNKRLSLERARAVEAWLRQRGNYSVEQLQALGAGSWLPINTGGKFDYLNRRVEVRLGCRATPAQTAGSAP